MEKYSSYKDSGVQWLGHIPNHWEVNRIASYFSERKTKVSDKDFAPLSVTKMGILPQLENVAKTDDGDNRKLVKANDFVINSRSDRRGSSGVSPLDGSVSLINIVLEPRHGINPGYCNYLLKSYAFIEEFYRNGHGIVADLWTTRYDEMKTIKICIPPYQEQEGISSYLDAATAKIDEAIVQQQRMIDLLSERKQIIIDKTTTKGAFSGKELHDSGVDYIGEIPEGWTTTKIKFVASYNDEVLSEDSTDKDIEYVEIGDVQYGKGITGSANYLFKDAPSRARRITRKGDIIVSTVRTYLKAVAVIKKDGLIVSTGFVVIRPKSNVDAQFLAYAILNSAIISEVEKNSVGTSYPAVNAWEVVDIKVPIPPIEEQKRIAVYLSEIEKNTEKAIEGCGKIIQALQERKQIIINNVVTGKVKVV